MLHSLFEEQIDQESRELDHVLVAGAESYAEALTYFPEPADYVLTPERYLDHVRRAKAAVGIPVIGSLNGVSRGGWVRYAREIEQAGADALELNVYHVPTDPQMGSAEVEQAYVDLLLAVRQQVRIPVAVKLSPFFTNLAVHGPPAGPRRGGRPGAVQPLLPAGHRPGVTGGGAPCDHQRAGRPAPAPALDRHPLRPGGRRPRGHRAASAPPRTP